MGGQLQQLSEEARSERATARAGGGMVTVEDERYRRGAALPHRSFARSTQGDRELIEDLLPAAINQALAKSKQLAPTP